MASALLLRLVACASSKEEEMGAGGGVIGFGSDCGGVFAGDVEGDEVSATATESFVGSASATEGAAAAEEEEAAPLSFNGEVEGTS